MIKSLLIGNLIDVNFYLNLISKVKYFDEAIPLIINETELEINENEFDPYDALFIVSQLNNPYPLFLSIIKAQKNIYFVDQPQFTEEDLQNLDKLQHESGNLVFTEVTEMEHPLVDQFLTPCSSNLLIRYNKSVTNKQQIRPSLFSALSFLAVLSPMQVKRINVNTMETTTEGKSLIKIELKMFDSSLCNIILKIDDKNEHNVLIESKTGKFNFNFADSYLENIHGKRFNTPFENNESLTQKSLESFAFKIILNKKPFFSFHNYALSISTLIQIERIIYNNL